MAFIIFPPISNESIREVVEEICRQLDARFEDCVEVGEARLGQDAAYLLDSAKARAELGWRPCRTVGDAIGDTAQWMKKNLGRLRAMPDQYIHKE